MDTNYGQQFWNNKRVLLTGHTGFKGSWLALWLHSLNANVIGYSLPPQSNPNLFTLTNIQDHITHIIGDIRDFTLLQATITEHQPEIIFHLAAQPLVLYSYQEPIETYSTNIMGTVHLLEAARQANCIKVIINVTSDKCYENKETQTGYKENDRLGGHDPYSNSKACCELITHSYHKSYFQNLDIGLASVRAGNVIGGGDWSKNRLIPDIMRAFMNNIPVNIRNPEAIRPWQHVLEPLSGYILLAEKLYNNRQQFSGPWNFGPNEEDMQPVSWVINHLSHLFDNNIVWTKDSSPQPHETNCLKLDYTKSKTILNWKPRWNLEMSLKETAHWYKAYMDKKDIYIFTLKQINNFINYHIFHNALCDDHSSSR